MIGQTVLVVDDNPITRKVVRVTLTAEGYDVREAKDGEAAIAEVSRQAPSLILQDLVLPDFRGIDLVARLRALPGAADIPILAFSALPPATTGAGDLDSGFTDYLVKPIEPSVLVQVVSAHLNANQPTAVLSSVRRRVLVADDNPIQLKLTALHLSGAEFRVSTVADGATALIAARSERPDIIVADVLMPGLDGFRLCAAVRADAQLAHIPVILQTASFTEEGDRALALSSGAAEFILRTPNGQDLIAAVSRILNAPAKTPAPLVATPAIDPYTTRIIHQLERQTSINVRLNSRVGWLESERAILEGLAEVIRGTPTIDTLVDQLLYRFVNAAGISFGLAYVVEPDGALSPRSRIGLATVPEDMIETFFGRSDLLHEVVRRGIAVILPSEDVTPDQARAVLSGLGAESAIIVPLGGRQEHLGVIALASERDQFDEDWRAFVQAVGVVIGQSIGLARTVAQLRQSEERSRRLLEAVPSGVVIADLAGRLTSANAAAARIIGVSRERIVAGSINDFSWDIQAVDDKATVDVGSLVVARLARSESIRDLELSLGRPDGSRAAISLNLEPYLDEDGRHAGGIFAITDITARKQAEQQLRQRARQQEAVARFGQLVLESRDVDALMAAAVAAASETLQVSSAIVYQLLPDGRQLRLIAGIGVADETSVGTHTIDVDLASQEGFTVLNRVPVLAADLESETRFDVPRWIRNAGFVSSASVPIMGQPDPFGVLLVHSAERRIFGEDDIHFFQAIASELAAAIARLQSEAAVRESEELYSTTFNDAPVGIAHTAVGGVCLQVNPRFAAMLGYTVEEMIGLALPLATLPEDVGDDEEKFHLLRDGQISVHIREKRYLHKDGFPVWVRLQASARRDSLGKFLYNILVVEDISERKQLEQQLQQAQRMEAIGQLAGGVAHDFNNLLTVIIGFSELLTDRTELTPYQRDVVAQIMHAGESAAGLTRQLLAFSRQQIITPRDLDLNTTVEQLSKMLRRLIGEDVALSVLLAPNLGTIRADPGQIEQILLNLATNARDAMPQGGRLSIETARVELDAEYASRHPDAKSGAHVLLTVTDSGIGMDAALQARIFEPFYTTKEVGKGTGLGLAAVHGIVKQNGGSIAVSSEVGVGTTFKVYFPRVAAPGTSHEEPARPALLPHGTETILVAEDDARVRALSRAALVGTGYTILEAEDGESALAVAERHVGSIHLLLTDVVMPRLDGRLLSEQMSARYPGLKILYVSGYTDDVVVRHGVVNATVEFLQKPFTMRTLCNKVRQVLDGS